MTSSNPGALPKTLRPPLAPLLAVGALAALLAGCLAPAPALPAAAAAHGDLPMDAASEPGAATAAAAGEQDEPCEPRTVLEDDRQTWTGGAGEAWFTLDQPCDLQATLDLRKLAGSLRVRIEGPDGVVLGGQAQGVVVKPVLQALVLDSEDEPGPYPPGAYRYAFEADHVAEFHLTVATSG